MEGAIKPHIEVERTEETEDGWRFIVLVKEKERADRFTVRLARDHWEKMTGGEEEPARIAERIMTFLLEREPKEALPPVISVKGMAKKFSDLEAEMNEL